VPPTSSRPRRPSGRRVLGLGAPQPDGGGCGRGCHPGCDRGTTTPHWPGGAPAPCPAAGRGACSCGRTGARSHADGIGASGGCAGAPHPGGACPPGACGGALQAAAGGCPAGPGGAPHAPGGGFACGPGWPSWPGGPGCHARGGGPAGGLPHPAGGRGSLGGSWASGAGSGRSSAGGRPVACPSLGGSSRAGAPSRPGAGRTAQPVGGGAWSAAGAASRPGPDGGGAPHDTTRGWSPRGPAPRSDGGRSRVGALPLAFGPPGGPGPAATWSGGGVRGGGTGVSSARPEISGLDRGGSAGGPAPGPAATSSGGGTGDGGTGVSSARADIPGSERGGSAGGLGSGPAVRSGGGSTPHGTAGGSSRRGGLLWSDRGVREASPSASGAAARLGAGIVGGRVEFVGPNQGQEEVSGSGSARAGASRWLVAPSGSVGGPSAEGVGAASPRSSDAGGGGDAEDWARGCPAARSGSKGFIARPIVTGMDDLGRRRPCRCAGPGPLAGAGASCRLPCSAAVQRAASVAIRPPCGSWRSGAGPGDPVTGR